MDKRNLWLWSLYDFATFLGPLMWGSIIAFMGIDSTAYRTAIASLTIFVLAGLLVLVFFKRGTEKQEMA